MRDDSAGPGLGLGAYRLGWQRGACSHEGLEGLVMSIGGGAVEGSPPLVVGGIDGRALVDQAAYGWQVAVGACLEEHVGSHPRAHRGELMHMHRTQQLLEAAGRLRVPG